MTPMRRAARRAMGKAATAVAVALVAAGSARVPVAWATTQGGFAFLEPFAAQTDAADPGLAEARAVERERAASEETARAGHLPSATLAADTGPSKTWQWNEGGRVGDDARATWNTQAGVSLRQNVWAGGLTSLRVDAAEARSGQARLDTERRRAAARVSLARDLANLVALKRRIASLGSLLTQARALEGVAKRKNASGFLGKKELLDTQRETLRADFEVRNLGLELDDALARTNRTYRLASPALDSARVDALAASLDALARAGLEATGVSGTLETVLGANKDLSLSTLGLKATERETETARRARLAPSLDLVAGATTSLYDNGSLSGPQRDAAPNRGVNAYGKIQFSMNLFSPQANAQEQEALARKETALASRDRVEAGVRDAVAQFVTRRAQLEARVANERALLAATEDLLAKNTRLFEAGEYDVLEVIRSQQDVARQRQALVDAEARLTRLGLDAAAAVNLGVIDGAGAAGTAGGGVP